LYRPGPLAYIPNFINRKHGKEAIEYDLPEMEEYLQETYGITVYQEQVMLLAQKLAGFSKGDADVLRKAMGKKDRNTLDKMKSKFIEGATGKNHPKDKLEKIWTDWEAFAQYAFNKSHSTCYAYVAYQTAYLKAHYPGEYMSAVLNNAGSIEKITFFMEECRRMGLNVLGPDINESLSGFAVNKESIIRMGLGGLKGVGEAAVESIIEERHNGSFKDIFDFIKRVNQRTVNKRSMECLIYAGAFDGFRNMHRAQYFYNVPGEPQNTLEKIIQFGNRFQANKSQHTNTLFGEAIMMDIPTPKIPTCEEWTLTQKLDHEKETTGMFISGHPLDHFKFELNHYKITALEEFEEIKTNITPKSYGGQTYRLAGLVTEAQHRITKNGKQFGVLHIEDYSGKMEQAFFGDDYVRNKDYFVPGTVVFIHGIFKTRWQNSDQLEFKPEKFFLLESLKTRATRQLSITVEAAYLEEESIQFLDQNFKNHKGMTGVRVLVKDQITNMQVSLISREGIEMNEELTSYLMEHPEFMVTVDSVI
ncbi:MAG: OB-fold nucleic acid binding domain-containing protein, partial [Bacteroidota bacterium]